MCAVRRKFCNTVPSASGSFTVASSTHPRASCCMAKWYQHWRIAFTQKPNELKLTGHYTGRSLRNLRSLCKMFLSLYNIPPLDTIFSSHFLRNYVLCTCFILNCLNDTPPSHSGSSKWFFSRRHPHQYSVHINFLSIMQMSYKLRSALLYSETCL